MPIEFPDLVSEAATIRVALEESDGLSPVVWDGITEQAVNASVSSDDIATTDIRTGTDVLIVIGRGERVNRELIDKVAENVGALVTAQRADLEASPVTTAYTFPGDKKLKAIHLTEEVVVAEGAEEVQLVTPVAVNRLHMAMFGPVSDLNEAEKNALDLILGWFTGKDGGVTPNEAVRLISDGYIRNPPPDKTAKLLSSDYITDLPPLTTEFLERYKSALIRVFEIGPNPLRTLRAAPQD